MKRVKVQPDYLVHDRKYKEAIAKGWPGWGGPERMAGEGIWLDRLFSYDDVPKSGRVLELGCGEGHYARLLAQKGYQVVGVDVSPTAIQWAKEKTDSTDYAIAHFTIDLTQPDVLAGKSFDMIVDGNCLHCIIGEDRQRFLANVHRLLGENGLFFISTLLSCDTRDKIIELEDKPYRHVPSKESLCEELESAGFFIRKFVAHGWGESAHDETIHATVHLIKSANA